MAAVSAPAPASVNVAPSRLRVIFAGLMLVMLLAALDQTIVATALPTIVGDLGGLSHLSWVTSAFLLAQTAVTPIYGKLGDLYGRKRVLQSAVLLFLAGSALCGLAGGMTELIAFRAVQGLGAGGLIVLVQAVVGDVVPPRERGKYQGLFGAVFGVASIAGPLLGGVIVQAFSWRWIFYVNLPLGALALVVLRSTLPSTQGRSRPVIDYLGAGVLAAALSAIVLVASLGGTTWAWGATHTIVIAAGGVVLLGCFVLIERRAAEPVLPLQLLRDRVFVVGGGLSLIVGFALFGSVTFLPLYFQTVDAATPSAAGLRLTPMMAGLLVMSITSGQLISRRGRYRIFPIVGTALMALGLFLLSRLDVGTSTFTSVIYLLILGLGLGSTMQVLVLAVQNAVSFEVLGAATSGVTLFRGIGGSLGAAVFGTIFSSRLASGLKGLLSGPIAHQIGAGGRLTGAQVSHLPPVARSAYEHAYVHALSPVFVAAGGVAAARLRAQLAAPRATAAGDRGEQPRARGQPRGAALARLARRDRARPHVRRLAGGPAAIPRAGLGPRRGGPHPRRDLGARPHQRARSRARPRAGRPGRRSAGSDRRRYRGAPAAEPARRRRQPGTHRGRPRARRASRHRPTRALDRVTRGQGCRTRPTYRRAPAAARDGAHGRATRRRNRQIISLRALSRPFVLTPTRAQLRREHDRPCDSDDQHQVERHLGDDEQSRRVGARDDVAEPDRADHGDGEVDRPHVVKRLGELVRVGARQRQIDEREHEHEHRAGEREGLDRAQPRVGRGHDLADLPHEQPEKDAQADEQLDHRPRPGSVCVREQDVEQEQPDTAQRDPHHGVHDQPTLRARIEILKR